MATYEKRGIYPVQRVSHYMERLETFFTVNDIEDAPENTQGRKSILLSVIWSKTSGLIRFFSPPKLFRDSESFIKSLSTKCCQVV